MQDADYHPNFVTSDGVASSDLASIGGANVEGVLMAFAPDPRKRPEAASIV
jgi:branched-chain amino acid transport system substrate-binding protein